MTATLPHPYVEMDQVPQPSRAAVITRWHELRRIAGVIAFSLGLVSGIVLAWPAMVIVAALGAGIAIDATLAIRSSRRKVGPTLVADISFTAVGLIAASVPPPATGMVVAYFVLVIAVLSPTINAWPIGLYAVVVGVAASVVPSVLDTTDGSLERSLASGVIVVAVFGISTIAMVREFTAAQRRGSESAGRRLEIADAIARASRALVAEDDAGALVGALDAIRQAMGVSVIFVERNIEDSDLGLCAVVVERAAATLHAHPSVDPQTRVPWSAMPGARSHLEGGAPFFYRVEEVRGTQGDRGGELGLKVEVNVPIIVGTSWIGVIGAADEDAERVWRTDDLVLMRTMADLTAAHWQREADGKVRDTLIGSLDGKLRHVEAIAEASRALLGEHSIDVAPAIAAIGTAAGVDEVFVTSTVADDGGAAEGEVTAVWVTPGATPSVHLGDRWSYRDIDDMRAALQSGDLFEETTDGKLRITGGIQAGGSWFGSVGFVAHDEGRPWSSRDQAFLRTFADMLGAFAERSINRHRLEESLHTKDQLIASVSHELRSPLTAVVGLAEELRRAGDDFDGDERDQLLAVIAEESAEMADMVEDLLVAARTGDGAIPVFPESIDFADVARSVLATLAVPDGRSVSIADGPWSCFADPARVRQITRNLLTNAFRYGGPHVTVTFGALEGSTFMDVTDDGSGVPEKDRDLIFEAYGRAPSSRTSKASVGLGLTLSRRLAAVMSGTLTYIADDGCTFRLTLPTRQSPDS